VGPGAKNGGERTASPQRVMRQGIGIKVRQVSAWSLLGYSSWSGTDHTPPKPHKCEVDGGCCRAGPGMRIRAIHESHSCDRLESLFENATLESKAPKQIIRLSLYLTWLWTYVQHSGDIYLAGVLVEVQSARKLAVVHTIIVAA